MVPNPDTGGGGGGGGEVCDEAAAEGAASRLMRSNCLTGARGWGAAAALGGAVAGCIRKSTVSSEADAVQNSTCSARMLTVHFPWNAHLELRNMLQGWICGASVDS